MKKTLFLSLAAALATVMALPAVHAADAKAAHAAPAKAHGQAAAN